MFAQFFFIALGLFSIITGIKDGDYLWAFCGLVMLSGSCFSIYQLKTGKPLFGRINT